MIIGPAELIFQISPKGTVLSHIGSLEESDSKDLVFRCSDGLLQDVGVTGPSGCSPLDLCSQCVEVRAFTSKCGTVVFEHLHVGLEILEIFVEDLVSLSNAVEIFPSVVEGDENVPGGFELV